MPTPEPTLFDYAERTATTSEVRRLYDCLRGGPASAKQISAVTGWTDRKVRAVAQMSKGAVLSAPGLPYRLASLTSVDEFNRTYDAAYAGQIRHMEQRRMEMLKAVHGKAVDINTAV
jgi:hypothetical protein